jgi:hypothetical protein
MSLKRRQERGGSADEELLPLRGQNVVQPELAEVVCDDGELDILQKLELLAEGDNAMLIQ